jgi:hypothetical protein
MVRKKRAIIYAFFEVFLAIILGILIWNLGIFTFLGYVIAFFSAIKNKFFIRKKNMALKLFIGTIIIYLSGLFLPFVIVRFENGDLFSGILMALLVIYIWLIGRKFRKHGKVR